LVVRKADTAHRRNLASASAVDRRFWRASAYLNRGALEGKRILSEKTAVWALQDQMRGLRFQCIVASSPLTADFDPFPGVALTHSFGFKRNETDVPGMRSAGSQSWAGMLNSHYWLDPKKGLAAVLMTQSLPFVEPGFMKAYERFERAVYG
jgi:methyl acetate hydrolase